MENEQRNFENENSEIFSLANKSCLIAFNNLMKNYKKESTAEARKQLSKKNKIQICYVDLANNVQGKHPKHDFFVDPEEMKYFIEMVYESLMNPNLPTPVRLYGHKFMGGAKTPPVSNIITFQFLNKEELDANQSNQKIKGKYNDDKSRYSNAMMDWKNIQIAKISFDKQVGRIVNGLIVPTGKKIEGVNFKTYYITMKDLLELCVEVRDQIRLTEMKFTMELESSSSNNQKKNNNYQNNNSRQTNNNQQHTNQNNYNQTNSNKNQQPNNHQQNNNNNRQGNNQQQGQGQGQGQRQGQGQGQVNPNSQRQPHPNEQKTEMRFTKESEAPTSSNNQQNNNFSQQGNNQQQQQGQNNDKLAKITNEIQWLFNTAKPVFLQSFRDDKTPIFLDCLQIKDIKFANNTFDVAIKFESSFYDIKDFEKQTQVYNQHYQRCLEQVIRNNNKNYNIKITMI